MERLIKELEDYCELKLSTLKSMSLNVPEEGGAFRVLSDRVKGLNQKKLEDEFIQKATSIFSVVDDPTEETKVRIRSIGKDLFLSYTSITLHGK